MESRSRARTRAGAIIAGLAMTALTGGFATSAVAASASTGPRFVPLAGSVTPTTDSVTGGYQSKQMSVEVALAPRNASSLTSTLKNLYSKNSSSYQHWLAKGQFDARFAPTAAARAAVSHFLTGSSLTVQASGSPFLVRATGTSAQVSAAFHTTLKTFRDPRGVKYFSNATAVQMPATLAPSVLGVVGLSNTVREHSSIKRVDNVMLPQHGKASASGSLTGCEAPYPTAAQLFNVVNNGVSFPFGYGGGPGCNGLTPSQTNSIYSAPHVGARGPRAPASTWPCSSCRPTSTPTSTRGRTSSTDLATTRPWSTSTSMEARSNPSARPVTPARPRSTATPVTSRSTPTSRCSWRSPRHADTIEVYNAPNDYTGQTELDEYTQIANDDSAAVVSSSWAVCENDVSAGYVQAENVVFEQMAAAGPEHVRRRGRHRRLLLHPQSDGTTIVNVARPASQPWVTSVGGTSLENYNPGPTRTRSTRRG